MKKLFLLFAFCSISNLIIAQKLSELSLIAVEDEQPYAVPAILAANKSLIVFVDTSCPYVERYAERIKDLAEYAESKGMKVLFVNPHQQKIAAENSVEQMKYFYSQSGWKGLYFSDPTQSFTNYLGATKMPEVFIVGLSGESLKVLYKGPIDDNPQNQEYVNKQYAKEAIQQISATGKGAVNNKVVSMGCHIRKF